MANITRINTRERPSEDQERERKRQGGKAENLNCFITDKGIAIFTTVSQVRNGFQFNCQIFFLIILVYYYKLTYIMMERYVFNPCIINFSKI